MIIRVKLVITPCSSIRRRLNWTKYGHFSFPRSEDVRGEGQVGSRDVWDHLTPCDPKQNVPPVFLGLEATGRENIDERSLEKC